jgi:Kef-type K+ transport system membrane component KefB
MFDSALLLVQIAVIVGVSRLTAWGFGRLRQPQVVGEMVAGIALGPTLFGWVAPTAYQTLFPPASLAFLGAVSQVGLVIFIFLIGVRVDFAELRQQSGIAVVTSNISVIVPLLMGIGLAQYLFPRYGNGDRPMFALFVGTAMSVTAFPVLARILMERNLLGTRLGSVAIACAAVDDLTAWILLAIIAAITDRGQNTRPLWLMFVYLAAYAGFMALLGRVLNAWSKRIDETKLAVDAILIFIVLALVSGAVGEWIGVHSFVGAFTAGLVTPRRFRAQLIGTMETVTLLILIPLFFALTGIRTNLIFSTGTSAWLDVVLIVVVAVTSKWGGTMIGALAKGMEWREACQLGLLMNTRGLVALIVLSVGLDRGILSASLYSMMVCMALVTTFMATPLMDRVGVKAQAKVFSTV